MREMDKVIAAKLAQLVLPSLKDEEDEFLSKCRNVGLSIQPLSNYIMKDKGSSGQLKAVNKNATAEKAKEVPKEVVVVKKQVNQNVDSGVSTEFVPSNALSYDGVGSLVSRPEVDKNPISKLKEMCDKAGCEQPTYAISEAPESKVNQKQWQCTASVTGLVPGKGPIIDTAIAFQKQQAKTQAAIKLLEKVNGSEQPDKLNSQLVEAEKVLSGPSREKEKPKNLSGCIIDEPVSQLVERENANNMKVVTPVKLVPPTLNDLHARGIIKSPTQLLYEYCHKFNVNKPIFVEGSQNPENGYFITKVTVGDCTGEGDGKKKVDSKENASLTVLVKLAEKSSELMNMLKNFKFF